MNDIRYSENYFYLTDLKLLVPAILPQYEKGD
jgi:hypothetical protein